MDVMNKLDVPDRCLNNRRSSGVVFILTIMMDPKTCLLCFFTQTYKKKLHFNRCIVFYNASSKLN
jgi:hypothetical protein